MTDLHNDRPWTHWRTDDRYHPFANGVYFSETFERERFSFTVATFRNVDTDGVVTRSGELVKLEGHDPNGDDLLELWAHLSPTVTPVRDSFNFHQSPGARPFDFRIIFVEDLSSQSLQILGSTCGFSAEELRRAFDEAKLGSVSQFNDTGGWMFFEVQSFWKEFNGNEHANTIFRRIGYSFPGRSKLGKPGHALKFSCFHKTQDENSNQTPRAEVVVVKTPKLLTASALIHHVVDCILQRDSKFLMTLATDALASLAAIETDGATTVSSWVPTVATIANLSLQKQKILRYKVGIWNSQKALRKLFRVCNLIQEATARGWTEGMEINPENLKNTVTEIIADLGLINSQLEEIYNVMHNEMEARNGERSLKESERAGRIAEVAIMQTEFVEYLTVLAAIFLPLNLFASIFRMNIKPLTENDSAPSLWDFLSVGLPGTITILVAVLGGRWLWRRRKDGARVALQEINEATRRNIQTAKKESRPFVPSSLQYLSQNPQSLPPIRPQFNLQPQFAQPTPLQPQSPVNSFPQDAGPPPIMMPAPQPVPQFYSYNPSYSTPDYYPYGVGNNWISPQVVMPTPMPYLGFGSTSAYNYNSPFSGTSTLHTQEPVMIPPMQVPGNLGVAQPPPQVQQPVMAPLQPPMQGPTNSPRVPPPQPRRQQNSQSGEPGSVLMSMASV